MITGSVTDNREARIRLTVFGPAGREHQIDVVIDTGFDGSLTLSPSLIATLGLPWRRRGRALLADGSSSVFDIYEASLMWDGPRRQMAVDEADTDPLIGMSVLDGHELTIQVTQGGAVSIRFLG